MANQLTPAERMRLAQRLQAQKAARMGLSAPVASDLSYYLPNDTAEVRPAAAVKNPLSPAVRGASMPTMEQKDEAAWYDRVGATVLDTVANVGLGAADVFEGIYDMGAGLVGEIGGWFSEDFKKAVVDHIDDDWTGGIEKTLDDLGLEHSYLNEEGVGEFVGGVARGVGGLLPAVAVTAAASYFSGGTLTAPTIQALGLGTTIGGAAGQSTEEALNEGASLGKALNYGVLSGAVEGVTEKLVGGPTAKIFGKGLLDSGEAVAKTGAKRIFKDMLGEGIEEGIATAANPLAKTTYKGAEALGEYTEPEFYGDILRDAASGAAVSAAFGNTVGRIMHTSGKDADIADSIEAIKNNNKEGARLVAENGALTESEEAKLRENKLKNIANIENALQSVSDEKRAKLIERHNLKSLFDESGKISPDFKAELMGGTVEAPNTENGAVEDGTGGSVPSGGVDRRYASYGLWGKQKTVDADLAAMTEDYRKITKDEGARVELYRGELTDAEAEAFASARRAINKLSDRTATGIELALIEGSSDSTRVNGVMKGNTVYLSKESLADGSWAETTVHEVTHFAEGTESYKKLMSFIKKDAELTTEIVNTLVEEDNPYGFTKADVDSMMKKIGSKEALSERETMLKNELGAHISAAALGSEAFMRRIIESDASLAEKLLNRIKSLKNAFAGIKDPSVRAQSTRLSKAEKLWLKAVDDAGYKYAAGKIVKMLEEEKERGEVVQEIVNRGKKPTSQFSLHTRSASDTAYLKAVEEGDMETAQRMVDEAARKAGYNYKLYHQTGSDFTVFDTRHKGAGTTDSETPFGVFMKPTSDNIGLKGQKQMRVFASINNPVSAKSRDGLMYELKKDQAIKGVQDEIKKANDEYRQKVDQATKDLTEYIIEYRKSHPDEPRKNIYNDAKFNEISDKEDDLIEEWGERVDKLSIDSKNAINKYLEREGYDGVIIESDVGSFGRHTKTYIALSNTQVKSADPVTYDDQGNVIPLSKRFDSSQSDIRFSLSSKQESDGARAKANANRSRSKTYTRAEAAAIVDVMIGDAVFGYGEYVGTLKGKGNIVDTLWAKLNTSDEKARKKYAFKLADAVIDSMVLNLAVDDPVMEVYTDRVEKLGAYVRKLDLTSINDELKNTGNAQHYRSRWQRYDSKGMTPDHIVSELAENGIIIEADNHADILFEIDAMYTEALQGIKDNSNLILEQVLDKAELDAYRNDLARRFLEASNELGSASKLSREYYEEYLNLSEEYEHAVELLEKDMKREIDANTEKTMKDIEHRRQQLEREREKFADWRKKLRESDDEFRDKMRDKLRNQEKTAKLIREVVFRAHVLGSYKKGTAYSVSEYNDDTFWSNLESLSNILRAGSISVTKTRSICRDLAGWMGWIHDPNQYDGLTEEQKYDIQVIRTNLEDLSYGDKSFTVGELQTLSITLAQITNFVKSYGKIRRQGKLVDAKPYAEKFIKIIEESNKIPRGLQRKFFESGFMGNFADPATLMRYADGYEEGFFTETFNEFREGAVTVAVTRMELMQKHDAFMKAHKKYGEHLSETVEFRGHKMTRSTAIALWMTSKRAQAQLGLVKSGIKYRYEPTDKDGKTDANGVKVYDIPPLGDPTADYTQNDIDQFMKDLRADLEKTFTDADRSYIAIVENTFDECGEIKREVDLERKGETNVADGYYFPIVRADKASSMDTESWREAVDRVNNLSMNKDTVKGAKSRLFIGSIDTILNSHVNQVSLYKGISTAVDNYNILVNLNVGSNKGAPISINERVNRTDFGKEALNYLKKLKEDIEQINRREIDDRGFTTLAQRVRGNYATYQLGANPKVWVTQLTSFVAANDILDASSIAKGMTIENKKLANGETEVDKYCPLAKQRNYDNVAYDAQSVSARVTNKIGEALMLPVGKVDRFVIDRLWGACQVQVEKNGGAKVGTVENKTEAGKLLQKVILETQQNALPTERSSAMRSTSEIKKTLTMFSADAMKIFGRVFDGFGRYYFAKQRLKGNITDEQRKHFEAEKKAGFKQFRKATAILLAQSVLMALVALGVKALLAQLDDKEPEEIAEEFAVDAVGNTLGGLPIFRDVYGFLMQGYELDSYLYTSFNDLMTSVKNVGDLSEKTVNGEATSQDYAKSIRAALYSAGQIFGLPTKNVYKYSTGLIARISPSAGYWIGSQFKHNPYRADLKKAIEAGDTHMISTIAGLITDENYSNQSKETKEALRALVAEGHVVLPRTLSDTVTVNNETVTLTDAQKAKMQHVYAASDKAVDELVSMQMFKDATDEEKAKALGKIYDLYYNLAVDHALELDTEERSILFAEVLDVELLAIIAARANELKADVDKAGKTVSGSRKAKVTKLVSSLKLTAAEKYMVMGYLGYKNVNGKNQVQSRINKSSLSRTEKEKLLAYCGY